MSMTRRDCFDVHLSENLTDGERKEIEWLIESCDKLAEALEYYTDSSCFTDPESMVENKYGMYSEPSYDCYPEFNANVARKALKEYKGESE